MKNIKRKFENIAVNCTTREENEEFLNLCVELDIATCSDTLATELIDIDVWKENKSDTCYGIYYLRDNRKYLEFSSKHYYIRKKRDIMSFGQFKKFIEDNGDKFLFKINGYITTKENTIEEIKEIENQFFDFINTKGYNFIGFTNVEDEE